jgi:hypothetical protein
MSAFDGAERYDNPVLDAVTFVEENGEGPGREVEEGRLNVTAGDIYIS